MKKIAILHTVPSVLESFPTMMKEEMADTELKINNTLDEFLASDAAINGFTQNNLNRLYYFLKAKEMEKPDVIVVTCSTLTPGVAKIRPFIAIPVIAIDDEMVASAVRGGERITILATAQSTIEPTTNKIREDAKKLDKHAEIKAVVCHEAYTAVKNMDIETHDRLVIKAAREIRNTDVIVLAQASMGHLDNEIEKATGIKTFSSPKMCIEAIKELLS